MSTFVKPENALKRAEELINVGQKQDALQALHDIITSKRSRAWQKTLERIMFKYIELCVDMRRGRYAKDGLIQYRIVCQQVNVTSLEEVIKHFMHLSTEKAEQARSQAQALEEALDVDDLEADKRPEDLMLSYVSGEKGKDRSDREVVTPWFKFLWETYRTVLEILRNNSKLEALYAMTAHRAFQFCKQYRRTTEFRRLCEIIRNHLANLNKYRDQRDRPDLSAPESLQLYLDTRFEQLKIATELELWQEAFRSVEDIYGLMCMVKKTPKASLMVVYYAKLTEIFWISSSHLYHAYAWLKLFNLQKDIEEQLKMTAHRAFQFCKQYRRTTEFRRLCEIIRNHLANLNKYRDQRDRPDLSAPESLQLYLDTRFEQLKIATELELWQEAFRSVEDIYGLMCMVKKTPKASLMVVYYAKLTEIFWISSSHLYHAYAWLKLFNLQKSFNKNLSQKDLQLIASSVVLAALSVVPYDSRRASHLELENEKERNLRMADLIGFNVDPKVESREMIAKGVLNCATQEVKDLYHLLEHEFLPLDLAVKVQPLLAKISKIGGKLASASSVPEVQLSQYVTALEKITTLRVLQQVSQVYQTMKIESLAQMIPFFNFLVVEKISVDAVKHKFLALKIDHAKGVVLFGDQGLESDVLRDHLAILAENLNRARAMIYPPRKKGSKLGEILPSLAETVDREHKRLLARKSIIEKRKEEHERQLLEMEREEESRRMKMQKITEEAEQKRLASEYEQRKNQRILREIEERELQEAQALLQEAVRGKKKGKKTILEGEKVTKQTVMELARIEQLRERQEMEKKLQKLAKTMDYLERAKREESAPLVEAAFKERLVKEQELHEREQQQEIELSRQRHDGDLKEKNRLVRMAENKERVMKRRQAEYDRLRTQREEQIRQELQARKQEREILRKRKFFLIEEQKRCEREAREAEARRIEEEERRKKEEAERKAKLDEIAEKQRQKEREIEEKARLQREALLGRTVEPPRPLEPPVGARPVEPVAVAAAPTPSKYVPKFRRGGGESAPPPPEPDRWGGGKQDDRPSLGGDRWRGGGGDDRRPSFGDGPPRSSWSSSRIPPRGER
ncbi:hypothetical protein CDL15_Pgr018331 [Punica granatum]|uniref:Eukaryotic translation initiation factor 3 subunit A n=1 Tax=Punica granatum TaxID=22663 RepID=A0A218WIG9_PUNGR|nr:hypothetical protein CDL15_Pgr018331 [Punica granatum]